jgi:hypothetical protein
VNEPFSRTTAAKVAAPAPPGGRHTQMVELMPEMVGNGMSGERIFQIFRAMYAPDLPDSEISAVISWGLRQHFEPSKLTSASSPAKRKPIKPLTKERLIANARRFVGEFRCEEGDLYEVSPIRLGENWREDSNLILEHNFKAEDSVCINTDYELRTLADGTGKAVIVGPGVTLSVSGWLERFVSGGVPESDAGAWMRINPVSRVGTGLHNAHCDRDVTSFRYLLLEMDKLPLELQFAVAGFLALPIVALILSGGKSLHAWVRLLATSLQQYRAFASQLLGAAQLIGIDPANKNPSRYCRLPGALRKIGAVGDGQQRLVYLNPSPTSKPIFA